jgi:segregation and condensation protein B
MNEESSEGGVLVKEIDPPEETSTQPEPEDSPETASQGAEEASSKLGPGEDLSDEELDRRLTALIYASPEPLSSRHLADLLERPDPARVTTSLKRLGERLESAGMPLELKKIAGGWRILTSADLDPIVGELVISRRTERMSPASLETLSIVAYRQPVTKGEVEAIRGVGAGPMLRSLVDRGLVKVVGRAKQPGSPLQYGTTRDFLDRFGLGALKDLPRDDELTRD